MSLNYDYLSATTEEYFVKKLADNIYDKSPLLTMLLNDGSLRKYLRGGRRIVEPVLYAKNTAKGVYSNFDTFDMTPPDNISAARQEWGHYYVTIAISGDDETDNMGESQILNLIAERTREAELALRDKITDDIYAGTDTKGIIGLDTLAAAGTYGGIAGGTFTWWVAGVDSSAHTQANMKNSTHASYVLTLLQAGFRSCKHGGETPNLIVTTQTIWDQIEAVLQQQAQYEKFGKRAGLLADGGFQVLQWRGIPIVADEKATANYMYMLNTNYMSFFVHPSRNFYFTGFKVPMNQDARAGQILLKAQLSTNNRRMHYKWSNLAAS
jgi:hypothetical protein